MNVRYLIVVIQMQLAPTAKGHTNVRADSVTLEMDKIARGIEILMNVPRAKTMTVMKMAFVTTQKLTSCVDANQGF